MNITEHLQLLDDLTEADAVAIRIWDSDKDNPAAKEAALSALTSARAAVLSAKADYAADLSAFNEGDG